MRQLIATAFVSLDGVMEGPGGEPGYRNSGWTQTSVDFDPAAYELKGREQDEAAAMMLGRRSYEAFSAVWPSMTDEFPQYNSMPKFVVSTTLSEDDLVTGWGETRILRGVDDIAELKKGEGGPISIHGSGELVRSLTDAGMVDRFHLLVFPVLLGRGARLFSDADKAAQRLRLIEHESYGNGVQKQIFDYVGSA
ncbi:dihydrofolate reductase family protein [Zhihengliuella halotolerans]|uniref:Dihydrofolate reductase n=1 Tax=Zhihengliuella halotolerans TaxID=370736 RepID=A0A4Q8ACE2_9MICC|nr:dihydrofolate reductase family protein [Zhihengliuella halotolerans]RZU61391.1 dihydrofolate reductase [Zhihengliuella halotolerans]